MDKKLTDELFGSTKLNLVEEVAAEVAAEAAAEAAAADMEAAAAVVVTAAAVGTTTEAAAAGKYIRNSKSLSVFAVFQLTVVLYDLIH
jgi:hypothetical protein